MGWKAQGSVWVESLKLSENGLVRHIASMLASRAGWQRDRPTPTHSPLANPKGQRPKGGSVLRVSVPAAPGHDTAENQ